MEQTKNLVIAVILASIVLFGWQYFYEKPIMEAKQQQALQNAHQASSPSVTSSDVVIDTNQALKDAPRILVDAPSLRGSISLRGARIDNIILPQYHEGIAQDSPDVTLLSPAKTEHAYFSEFGWLSTSGVEMPTSHTIWNSDKSTLRPNEKVTLTWTNKAGILFTIELLLDDKYMLNVKQSIYNNSSQPIDFYNYGLISRIQEEKQGMMISHEGAIGVFNKILEETTYADLKKEGKVEFKNNAPGSWLGISDKYWLTAIIPDMSKGFDSNFGYKIVDGRDRYRVDFISQMQTVAPTAKVSYDTKFFMGAKILSVLDDYEARYKIDLFDRAIDFGWFYFITKPMFKALKLFYDLLGNFGLSILMVTIIVKLLLYPLANKSFNSMNKMKLLQPQINDIRERFANDKIQMNKEIMELYKKQQVNPLSGCLPILIQIPIFFSLYKVLYVTIEMRHAPFYGWIHDLSAPDPTSIFNLFGLIPWNTPAFLTIGIWPILMAITMFIQQTLNPPPADPVQAKMMKFLPVFFLFMFSSFPAGLIIYWAWSNLLSILQQWWLQKSNS